jgi:hypothetical protein
MQTQVKVFKGGINSMEAKTSTWARTQVKVFKGSINSMEAEINTWATSTGARIASTTMTYDEGNYPGHVFVIVVYEL